MTLMTLMRRYPEKETNLKGVGVYSDMVESLLRCSGTDFDEVHFELSTSKGYLKCLNRGFIHPLYALKKTDSLLYHATDELCCLQFPNIKGRKIVTFHHVWATEEGSSPLLSIVWKLAAKRAIKHSDAIIAVSNQTRDELVVKMGADPGKIYVLEHSVDAFFEDLGRSRSKMIGFVGTLVERKNVDAGIRAFKRFTEIPGTEEYKFIICGKGPMREELGSLVESLDISDRVEFVSDLSREELLNLYNEMAVFANSSIQEGLGLTALEARACGTPVVFFEDADIPREATENFIPSKDEKEFAQNMHRLVTDDEYRASATGRFSFGYGPEEYSKKLFDIYSKVLGREFLEHSNADDTDVSR